MTRAAMPRVLFLDDGGVISDNTERSLQWQRLLGDFFAPRLGGTPEAWAAANVEVTSGPFSRGGYGGFDTYVAEVGALRDAEWESAQYANNLAWLRRMCELVGASSPTRDAACLDLVLEANDFVTQRVRAPFPEVVEAIRGLHADGYVIHTASGHRSIELDGYLRALEIRDCFASGPLYGCDVVRMPKVGPEFYARIFTHTGAHPSDALVVDDSPRAVAWATVAGARALLLDRQTPTANGISSLLALRERLALKPA
jgi:phosphoglycolate phosphatase-like HAD superfamily hydrolase